MPCLAQNDTTLNLNEVKITSTRLLFTSGLRQYSFDSTLLVNYSHLSLSDLLNENSAISLKNYGPGELSTTSLRGGSAYHTTILWNGFSLASPMHGQTDLSLEKNFFFDDITIQYGGSSFAWGSGAVSGSINLNNSSSFNSGLKLITGFTAGSFSSYSQFAGISWGNNKYYGTVRFLKFTDENNFSYYDENTSSDKKQIHARIKQTEFISENYFRTGRFSIMNFRIWGTNSNRQIPPSIQQVNSHAEQKDENIRLSAEWKLQKNKFEYIIRTAFFNEKLNYNNDFLTQASDNTSKSSITESTFEKHISSRHILQFGINNNYSIADSSANFKRVSVNRTALFILYRYHSINDKIDFSVSERKEFSSLRSSPAIFSGGINYYPLKSLQLRLAASKVYRNPTLNDLYYIPGGNINLKAETGYSCETGIQIDFSDFESFRKIFSGSQFVLGATAYRKQISNWIIWYPFNSSIWKPENLKMVNSHGIEINLKYIFSKNNFIAKYESEYYYTISTNEKLLFTNDASLHRQLIYVPVHRWNNSIYVAYKTTGFRYNHSYTGLRYTSSDNTYFLAPYSLDNLETDKTFIEKSFSLKIFFRVTNLFNTRYQSILNLPMPLRSFGIGITFTFTKNNQLIK